MKDYNSLFNEKLGELIKDVPYPESCIIEGFGKTVLSALKHHNELTLEVSLQEYMRVFRVFSSSETITMQTMYVALQATMSLRPTQMFESSEVSQYCTLKGKLISMKSTWDAIAAPYIKQAQEAVKAISESDLQKENAMRGLKPKKRLLLPS